MSKIKIGIHLTNSFSSEQGLVKSRPCFICLIPSLNLRRNPFLDIKREIIFHPEIGKIYNGLNKKSDIPVSIGKYPIHSIYNFKNPGLFLHPLLGQCFEIVLDHLLVLLGVRLLHVFCQIVSGGFLPLAVLWGNILGTGAGNVLPHLRPSLLE